MPRNRLALGFAGGFILLTIVVALNWTAGLDRACVTLVAALRMRPFNGLALSVTSLGSNSLITLSSLLAIWYALAAGHRDFVGPLVAAPLASFLSSELAKFLVHHPRPTAALIAIPESFGYPSGHAAVASATWLTFALLALRSESRPAVRRVLLGAGVAVALLVGWSRIYLGVHYLSDVIGGLLLGSAWAVALARTTPQLRA